MFKLKKHKMYEITIDDEITHVHYKGNDKFNYVSNRNKKIFGDKEPFTINITNKVNIREVMTGKYILGNDPKPKHKELTFYEKKYVRDIKLEQKIIKLLKGTI